MAELQRISRSVQETLLLGEKIASKIAHRPQTLIGLTGELGTGKTILSKGLLTGFGLDRNITVQSPTYMIYKRYDAPIPLYHYDFYRLNQFEDLEAVDFWEAVENGIVLIEWYDRFKKDLPALECEIHLQYGNLESERVIRIVTDED